MINKDKSSSVHLLTHVDVETIKSLIDCFQYALQQVLDYRKIDTDKVHNLPYEDVFYQRTSSIDESYDQSIAATSNLDRIF